MEKTGGLTPRGSLLLCLFVVPLLGWLTGHYVEYKYESQFREMVVNEQKYMTAEDFAARGLTYVSFCRDARAEKVDPDTDEFCSYADEIQYAKQASLVTAAVGVLLFGLIIGGRTIAGTNRKRLSLIFGPLVRIVMLLLAVSVLAQGALLIYSIYTIEVSAIQRVHGFLLLMLGLGAIAACWILLKSSIAFLKSHQPMVIRATALDKAQHGGFFDFINGIASKLKAEKPDHIVVGLEPNFFVTASDVQLAGTDSILRGRTLFVSLGLLRVFSREELAAVIGHELGHFRGGDVAYSMKFAPIYSRLTQALENLGQTTEGAAALGRLPAVVALSVCLLEFASAERSIGRERELEADRAGAEAADGLALARALVKVSLYGTQWSVLTKANIDALAEGKLVIVR